MIGALIHDYGYDISRFRAFVTVARRCLELQIKPRLLARTNRSAGIFVLFDAIGKKRVYVYRRNSYPSVLK